MHCIRLFLCLFLAVPQYMYLGRGRYARSQSTAKVLQKSGKNKKKARIEILTFSSFFEVAPQDGLEPPT